MPELLAVHHAAIICSDYACSRRFYVDLLGLKVVHEVLREARQSWKLDLALPDGTQIELFSFPRPPARPSRPEACGLRHLAFAVASVDEAVASLVSHGVEVDAGARGRVHRPPLHLLRGPGRAAARTLRGRAPRLPALRAGRRRLRSSAPSLCQAARS